MTDAMKKTLYQASGNIGAAGSRYTFEAQKNGWVKCVGTRQNSTTLRYKITPEGVAELERSQ